MKTKRPKEKSYITILLDTNEHEKLKRVKMANHKISNRKIFMAMVDALLPVNTIEESQTVPPTPENIMTDETVIIEEE